MKFLLSLLFAWITSCSFHKKSDSDEGASVPPLKSPQPIPQKIQEDPQIAQRMLFLQEPLVQIGNHNHWGVHLPAIPRKGAFGDSVPFLANTDNFLEVELPVAFYTKLPVSLRESLQHQGIGPEKTEIAMRIVSIRYPITSGPDSKSRLVNFYPHGWIFSQGETGKKSVLQGVFSPSFRIDTPPSYAIAVNGIRPVEVEIRKVVDQYGETSEIGEKESPQKMLIPEEVNEFSFWSLVVDPNGDKKAIATFHWNISRNNGVFPSMENLTVSGSEQRKKTTIIRTKNSYRIERQPYTPRVPTFGAWLERITSDQNFYKQPALKQIGDEIRSWFGLSPVSIPGPLVLIQDENAGVHHQVRFEFLQNLYLYTDTGGSYQKFLVQTHLTAHYDNKIPPVTILADYPRSGQGSYSNENIVMRLPVAFREALPRDLQRSLEAHGISNPDIALVIGNRLHIGEKVDHEDGSPLTSRLRAHGWADPDAPTHYTGTRMNRDFLYGIFEPSTPEIGREEIPVGNLAPFNLHVHDERFSPRNTRLGIPPAATSFSFWSLVVDPQPGGRGAIATWHFYMSPWEAFLELYDLTQCRGTKITPEYLCAKDLNNWLGRIARSQILMEDPEFPAYFQKLLAFFAVKPL
jgi:hypothetical protein